MKELWLMNSDRITIHGLLHIFPYKFEETKGESLGGSFFFSHCDIYGEFWFNYLTVMEKNFLKFNFIFNLSVSISILL